MAPECSWVRGHGSQNMKALVLVICVVAFHCWAASARRWTVGDSEGWAGIDYTNWTRDKVFTEGDVLFFPYKQGAHDVAQVSEAGYQACRGSNAADRWIDGNTTVTLRNAGTHYFICTFPGHCPPMKLAVKVVANATSPTTPPSTNDRNSSNSGGGGGGDGGGAAAGKPMHNGASSPPRSALGSLTALATALMLAGFAF